MLSLSKHSGRTPLPATLRQAQGDFPLLSACHAQPGMTNETVAILPHISLARRPQYGSNRL
jgi:hypothetical protein